MRTSHNDAVADQGAMARGPVYELRLLLQGIRRAFASRTKLKGDPDLGMKMWRRNRSVPSLERMALMPVLIGDLEQAAIRSTSSRKGQTSITHLLNFTLPPRPQLHPRSAFGRNGRRNPTWGLGSGHHAVDKARSVSHLIRRGHIYANT